MSRRRTRTCSSSQTVDEPLINLTPLIDVVFVILIMFIVVAPLLETDRVDLAKSTIEETRGQTIQESSLITIHVHRDNKILFNHQPVTLEELPSLFREAKKKHPHTHPQLFHDRQGHFEVYQAIKNAAENAGFEQMDVILNPA